MRTRRVWSLLLLCASATAVAGCSNDDGGGIGYCLVTSESAEVRGDGSAPGELVQADSGCIGDEILVCGTYNSRGQFVSDDCADGVGAPEDDD